MTVLARPDTTPHTEVPVLYAAPAILDRQPLAALLQPAKSDLKPDGDISDVHRKENIRPVTWAADRVRYEAPSVAGREHLAALLDVNKSDVKPDSQPSDVAIKDHIVPVRW